MAADLQLVGFDRKTHSGADFTFELVDLVALEFDDPLAIFANDVVVMRVFGVIGIVELVVFAEIHFPDQPTLGEQWQGSIDRGARDGGITAPGPLEELFSREVFFGAERRLDDSLTLRGEPQVLSRKELSKAAFGAPLLSVCHNAHYRKASPSSQTQAWAALRGAVKPS